MILPLLFRPVIPGFRSYPGWSEDSQVQEVTSLCALFVYLTGESEGNKGDEKIHFGVSIPVMSDRRYTGGK
jgi:hypothetical protein